MRRHYQVQSREEMEVYWFRRQIAFFEPFVRISGLEMLKVLREEERGVVLFSGHIGSIGLSLTLMGLWGG